MRAAGFILLASLAAGAPLDDLTRDLAARGTKALYVTQYGRPIAEWYAEGVTPATRHGTASLAKSLVGGMSLMLALDEGRIRLDEPASKYITGWAADPVRTRITVRQLATHTSGISDAEHGKPGWMDAFWKREPDPFTVAIRDAPMIAAPGERFHYSNPGMAALAYAVTASLAGAPQNNIRSLIRQRIALPQGVPDEDWSIGYGRAYERDGLHLWANWGGGSFTPRAVARFADVMLHGGRNIVSRENALLMITPSPGAQHGPDEDFPANGPGWYSNANGAWPELPHDAFAGAGAGHQLLLVVPSRGLIAVRFGTDFTGRREPFWKAARQYFFAPLVQAVAPAAPYPPSPVIRGIRFDASESIRRAAPGSDNWPTTWANNGLQYTVYGDGWGFEPRVEKKLSQGFAVIDGMPENFRAVNLRSESGERLGDGKNGLKASGILMVDGMLYMWVRNAGNSQIWWSHDLGVNWVAGFKFETSFGSPAFLNFGPGYKGARDGYVYTYSQDGPSAYEQYDSIVLARAPKTAIHDRGAWEFFVKLDAARAPVWTRDITRRGAVFDYPRRCGRVDAVFNAGVKRYLLALGFNHDSGWGIFDAPEPWGPWTTAFHTGRWDLEGTHGYRLPAKWISEDGRRMTLIFSGLKQWDAFCLRGMRLETGSPPR
jgi:CubicO group peptidase (beta-lactamase class C family)